MGFVSAVRQETPRDEQAFAQQAMHETLHIVCATVTCTVEDNTANQQRAVYIDMLGA